MKWWEKTVEYYFVRKYLTDSAIAPLDGNEESAGDAVFGRDGKLVLIEFKRDLGSIDQEKVKFHDFELAKQKLKDNDYHHYLIFGVFDADVTIFAKTYFSEKAMSVRNG